MLKWTLLLTSSVAVVLAVLLYRPLPAGVSEPWKVQTIMMLTGFGTLVARTLTYLERGTFPQNLRYVLEKGMPKNLSSRSIGDVEVSRDVLDGVPVVVYRPKSLAKDELAPAVVFFHGGGFVVGCADTYDLTAHSISAGAQLVVVSVDYRRAPEHPFPAAPHDSLAATRHILRHGDTLGIDVTKVGVAGDSAGGNLAAVVSLQLSKEQQELPPLRFQVLYYPLLQAVDFLLPSYLDNDAATPNLLSRDFVGYIMALYFGLENEDPVAMGKLMSSNLHIPESMRKEMIEQHISGDLLSEEFRTPKVKAPAVTSEVNKTLYEKLYKQIIDPLFCPLMAEDVSDVPPAFIHAAEFDVLRDDALLYTRKLFKAGVHVEGYFSQGGYHSEIQSTGRNYLKPETGKVALQKSFDFIRNELELELL